MTPARRSRQQIQALLKLRELILGGAFLPGQRISELEAVARLGISRTPVRMALTHLAHEGFLQASPGGGFIVRNFSVADVQDSIELRGVLEGVAVRKAAEHRLTHLRLDPMREIVAALDVVVAKMQAGEPNFEDYIRLNGQFHEQMALLADSPMLQRSLAHIATLPFASPNAFVHLQGLVAERIETLALGQVHHRAILEAICEGEGARADALAQEHARLARRNLRLVLDKLGEVQRVPGGSLVTPFEETKPKHGRKKPVPR